MQAQTTSDKIAKAMLDSDASVSETYALHSDKPASTTEHMGQEPGRVLTSSLNRAQRRAQERAAGKPTATQRLNDRVQTQQRLNNFYKHNTLWDDLENVFQQCATQLITCLSSVTNDMSDPVVNKFLVPENLNDIHTAFAGMTQDSQSMSDTLAQIHARHINNHGTTRSQDETSRAHLIMNDYHAWQTRYEALIKPNFAYLAEQIAVAVNRSRQVADAIVAANTDPTVVTDVVAKEIPA